MSFTYSFNRLTKKDKDVIAMCSAADAKWMLENAPEHYSHYWDIIADMLTEDPMSVTGDRLEFFLEVFKQYGKETPEALALLRKEYWKIRKGNDKC